MLTSYHDDVLTAMYHTTARKWVTSASARGDWKDCIDGLEDQASGQGS